MKVEVHWDKKNNNAKYTVQGKDIKSAVQFMNSRGEWGDFKSSITHKHWENASNIVNKVRLIPSYVITMPNWPAYRNQTQDIKDSWDTMYKALLKHEEGHREIFQQGLNKLIQDIDDLPNPTPNDFESLFNQSIKAMQKKQDDFDTETEHGAARGVEIIIE